MNFLAGEVNYMYLNKKKGMNETKIMESKTLKNNKEGTKLTLKEIAANSWLHVMKMHRLSYRVCTPQKQHFKI